MNKTENILATGTIILVMGIIILAMGIPIVKTQTKWKLRNTKMNNHIGKKVIIDNDTLTIINTENYCFVLSNGLIIGTDFAYKNTIEK